MYNFATTGTARHEHPAVVESTPSPTPKHSSHTGVYIGILIVLVVAVAAYYYWRKRDQ